MKKTKYILFGALLYALGYILILSANATFALQSAIQSVFIIVYCIA